MAKQKYDFTESAVWKALQFAGNAIMLNVVFLAFCLPIVTIGPAFCGLYSGVRYYIRKDSWFKGFIEGFKTNVWRMMAIWVAAAAAILYLGNDVLTIAKNFKPEFLPSLIPISLITLLLMAFLASVIVYNVYFPRKTIDLLTEAASFTFKAFPALVLSAVLFWAPVAVLLVLMGFIFEFVMVFIAVYFVVVAAFSTAMLKKPLIKVLEEKRASGELPPKED